MQKEILIYSNGKQAQIFSDGKLYGKYITEIHFEHVSLESELRLVCTGVPVTGTTYGLRDFRKKVKQLLKGKSEKKGRNWQGGVKSAVSKKNNDRNRTV